MPEKSWIDTAVPIILIGLTAGFFWIKLKMYKYAGLALEWLKENLKSKKPKAEEANSYSYIDYEG